ncbi:MAG: UDP-3-O-(3-hydroxymyristoyl)glucosamine N-acyltransferase [Elusimicrobia bacterium]|nr:UDP-3-O-(3-hydroxymyristoyl)glucosamine N-acyltransferase [Elusimicrobiota bacterium]
MLRLPNPTPVSALAELVGGQAEGESGLLIEGASTLEKAQASDISFLGNPKYAEAAAASEAGCLLLPPAAKGIPGRAKSRIYVEDPQYAFSQVLWLIANAHPAALPSVSDKASVHYQAKLGPNIEIGAFSVVEKGCLIGEATSIGAQCYIGENVRIGRHCKIYPQVVIREGCVLGDRVIIHSGTVVGADGFGFSTDKKTGKHRKIPQLGNVIIGDDVELGANVTIDRATIGSTEIGPGSKIDNLVQLAHNVKIGRDCIIVSQAGVAGSSELGDRVILAGQAGVVGHIKLGDGAIIMAQTGVTSDVDKGAIMFGSPAKPRREAFKLQALYNKLPEIYEALKLVRQQLGVKTKESEPRENESRANHD